ncbi:MAG: MarR family winged helix-turn-helix transcriptional regulator [Janthinobacterium lividum]
MTDLHIDSAALDLATYIHRSALGLSRQLRSTRVKPALSTSKLLVLAALRRDGRGTAVKIAAEMDIQPQSLTRVLAALEADGLLARQPDASDRRQSLLALTAAGGQALDADLLARRQRLAQALVETLTPVERQVLKLAADLTDKLVVAIGARAADSAPQRGNGNIPPAAARRKRAAITGATPS